MKNLLDVKEQNRRHHKDGVYGISISKYYFEIFKIEYEYWYKGEDSGAQYPQYSDSKTYLEIYNLSPILDNIIGGVSLKTYIDKMISNWPPLAGRLYAPRELYKLYSYLDDLPIIKGLRIK